MPGSIDAWWQASDLHAKFLAKIWFIFVVSVNLCFNS